MQQTSTSSELNFAATNNVLCTEQSPQDADSTKDSFYHTLAANEVSTGVREVIAWTLAAVSTVLFVSSLTINIIMLWIYKKRQRKDNMLKLPCVKWKVILVMKLQI